MLQGGLVLSEAVKECGILKVAAGAIEDATDGLPLWQMVAVFCALVLVCTTFVSHTVGAMVILPVVASVGAAMPQPHPRLLVMATALMCSGAMGLPVSGARLHRPSPPPCICKATLLRCRNIVLRYRLPQHDCHRAGGRHGKDIRWADRLSEDRTACERHLLGGGGHTRLRTHVRTGVLTALQVTFGGGPLSATLGEERGRQGRC